MSVIPNNNSIVIFYNDRNFSIPIENCPFLFVVALLATYFQFVDGFKRMDASVILLGTSFSISIDKLHNPI